MENTGRVFGSGGQASCVAAGANLDDLGGAGRGIPNPKYQTPNKAQFPNSKNQRGGEPLCMLATHVAALEFGIYLELGIWDLDVCSLHAG
jgi:hypothetical protein